MSRRFVQVNLDFVDSKACGLFSLKLGIDRDSAAGKMVRVWGWALQQAHNAEGNDPIRSGFFAGDEAEILISDAARWTKSATEFVDAAEYAGLVVRTKKGIRFKGWEDRYDAMLRKQLRDNAKPTRISRGKREGNERVEVEVEVEVEVDRDVDTDVDTDTATNRSSAAGSSVPRELSWQQELFAEMQASRLERLTQLEVEAEPEAHKPAFVNAAVARIAKAAGGGDVGREAVLTLFDAYLHEDWPTKYTPPYPFNVFASEKVWPKLLASRGDA